MTPNLLSLRLSPGVITVTDAFSSSSARIVRADNVADGNVVVHIIDQVREDVLC